MSWYEKHIENGIRDVVKLLRDNGFNTTCSCEHEMDVECTYDLEGEMKKLHDLIYVYLAEKNFPIEYEIQLVIKVELGIISKSLLHIKFTG